MFTSGAMAGERRGAAADGRWVGLLLLAAGGNPAPSVAHGHFRHAPLSDPDAGAGGGGGSRR